MNHHVVRVSHDVYDRLRELARDGESPNAVLRRLFGLPPNQVIRSNFKGVRA